MAPLTTVAELQSLLGWQNVTDCAPTPGWRVFAVWPSQKFLPQIEFVFDDKVTMLQQLGFGPWHGHYDMSTDERRNVRRAIATARTLVSGARCLLVERADGGAYLGSSIYRRAGLPLTLAPEFRRLERLVFDRTPEDVPIDLAGFHRTKNGSYIEHAYRLRLKRVYTGTAVDPAMFD